MRICIFSLERLFSTEHDGLEWSVDAERVRHVSGNMTLYGLAPPE